MKLFKAIVLDVWSKRQAEVRRLRVDMERRVQELRGAVDRVDDAFLHARIIDGVTYERQRDRLREQILVGCESIVRTHSTYGFGRPCSTAPVNDKGSVPVFQCDRSVSEAGQSDPDGGPNLGR